MRTLVVFALASAVACGGSAPDPDPVVSCQSDQRIPASSDAALDILLVIDSSESMAAHGEKLDAFAADLAAVLDSVPLGRPSLQVGVVAADITRPAEFLVGTGCLSDSVPFVYDFREPWWQCGDSLESRCGVANHDGDLAAAATCVTRISAAGDLEPRPLDAMTRALSIETPDSAGFLRENAFLFVVVIASADDGSADAVQAYVERLGELKKNPALVARSAVAPQGSARLQAFVGATGTFVDIDATAWAEALLPAAERLASSLGRPCLSETIDPIDIDTSTPGLQLDCNGELETEQPPEGVPACQMLTARRPHPETVLPCYWLDPVAGDDSCRYSPRVELDPSRRTGGFKLSCASTCGAP